MDADNLARIDKALGRIASGLFILTVKSGDRQNAMLASWVMQAGFEPPTVSVALKPGRPVVDLLSESGRFVLNVIPKGRTDLLKHFARGFEPGADPYAGIPRKPRSDDGPAILADALAYLDCRTVASVMPADHAVWFGRVVDGALLQTGEPWVHQRESGLRY